MMTEITIYSLQKCKKCKYFFSELLETEVRYTKFVCQNDSKECDDVEDIVKCSNYPIVEIKTHESSLRSLSNQTTYLCLGSFQEIVSFGDNTVIEYCTSLDQMVRKTVNHYSK